MQVSANSVWTPLCNVDISIPPSGAHHHLFLGSAVRTRPSLASLAAPRRRTRMTPSTAAMAGLCRATCRHGHARRGRAVRQRRQRRRPREGGGHARCEHVRIGHILTVHGHGRRRHGYHQSGGVCIRRRHGARMIGGGWVRYPVGMRHGDVRVAVAHVRMHGMDMGGGVKRSVWAGVRW